MTKRAVSLTVVASLTLAVLGVLAPTARAAINKPQSVPPPAAEPIAASTAQGSTIDAPAPPLLSLLSLECQLAPAAPETQAASASNGHGPKPKCGNGTCEPGEDSSTCPSDCPDNGGGGDDGDGGGGGGGGGISPTTPRCGDRICAWPAENVNTCPFDCPCQTPFGGPIC